MDATTKTTRRFGALGTLEMPSPNTNASTAKSAAPLRMSQERIGAPLTAEQVESYTVVHRGWLIGLTIVAALLLGGVIASLIMSGRDARMHIKKDSLANDVASKAVEVTVAYESSCSGSHVHQSGEVLTAVHCFQEDSPCDFDVSVPEFPLADTDYIVDVMGVNGTGEKWTFNATVLGWSGITDVMVLQLQPLTLARGGVVSVTRQEHLKFNPESNEMERGQEVWALSNDYDFLKKLGHAGVVMAPGKDIGSDFAVGVEQVFVDTNARPGASGSAVIDASGRIIMAPLTYAWGDDAPFAVSGTSSRVSSALVKRILNPELPPNGPNNKYLVPTLGIVPLAAVNGEFLYYYGGGSTYLPWTENKGIWFGFLLTQDLYEFVTDCGLYCCGFDPYTVTPPSILGAPLDKTISGSPPLTMTDFPGGCLYCSTLVILEAVEVDHRWHYVGDDVGLETVSGLIIGSGKWAGDTVRVRVRSLDPYNANDPSLNWEGIYLVTLQAIDPFWDNLQTTNILSLSAKVRVDKEDGRPARMYASNDVKLPSLVVGPPKHGARAHPKAERPLRHGEVPSGIVGTGPNGRIQLRDMLNPLGPGQYGNVTDLPTLLELYQEYINNKYPAKKHAMERSIANRNAYIAAHGLDTHAKQRSLYDHMRTRGRRGKALFFDRTTVSRTHKIPTQYRKLPALRKPMTSDIWKRMKLRGGGQIAR